MSAYDPLQQSGIQVQVGFADAIQMGFNKYASFAGRSSRSEYWWWQLFTFIVGVCGYFIGQFIGVWFGTIIWLALFIPSLSVTCRRLHDIGRAAGWIFIGLIPVVGQIILIAWACQQSEPVTNRFGEVPNVM